MKLIISHTSEQILSSFLVRGITLMWIFIRGGLQNPLWICSQCRDYWSSHWCSLITHIYVIWTETCLMRSSLKFLVATSGTKLVQFLMAIFHRNFSNSFSLVTVMILTKVDHGMGFKLILYTYFFQYFHKKKSININRLLKGPTNDGKL